MTDEAGWGGSEWGDGAWGAGEAALTLGFAQAIRENVVRLTFTAVPLFTNLGGSRDAAQTDHYSISPTDDARPVLPVMVEQSDDAGAALDITVDRHFSPYPAIYRVSVTGLVSTEGSYIVPASSLTFYGMQQGEYPSGSMDSIVAGRDLANPQSARDLLGTSPAFPDQALGTYQIAPDGDYATDTPYVSWRKRAMRRVLTRVGGFRHLQGYGTPAMGNVKRQARPLDTAMMALEAERQVRLEPETLSCKATVQQIDSLTYLRVVAMTTLGMEPQSFTVQVPNG